MSTADGGSPGSHPHSDRPNWQPGDDDAEELMLQKLADALRDGASERQIAKLLDVPRSWIWRAKKCSAIPEGLFERLLDARVGRKALLYIGRYCDDGELPPVEPEYCPHCGHRLRVRSVKEIRRAIDILNRWIEDGSPGPSDATAMTAAFPLDAAARGGVAVTAASAAAARRDRDEPEAEGKP